MTATVYLNGDFINERDAVVSVYDGGWLHGAGLFETMRAENGCVFRLESHIERLRRSASKLLTDIQRDALPASEVFTELLERNGVKTARVRMTVSAGSLHPDLVTQSPDLTVCVTASKLTGYPSRLYESGAAVVIGDFRLSPSDPIAGHKTTGFLPRLLCLRRAQQARCLEAIWFTTGNHLAEGSISNVFIAHQGVLKTPPLDTPVLPGIARGVVLEIARDTGIEAQQCPLTVDDLLDADEVLLTNAIMQVMPVVHVERHDIRDGRVGQIAKKLLTEYRKRVKKECGEQ